MRCGIGVRSRVCRGLLFVQGGREGWAGWLHVGSFKCAGGGPSHVCTVMNLPMGCHACRECDEQLVSELTQSRRAAAELQHSVRQLQQELTCSRCAVVVLGKQAGSQESRACPKYWQQCMPVVCICTHGHLA